MRFRPISYWWLSLLMGGYAGPAPAGQDAMQSLAMMQTTTETQQMQTPGSKLLQAGPLFFQGTLGDEQVQANLRAKADVEEGFEGDYFLFGQSQKVLLAGEIDGDDVFMEESMNGTDVSGQWNGKLNGDVVSGTWQSADGLVIKPFAMKIVRNDSQPASATTTTANSAGQARQ